MSKVRLFIVSVSCVLVLTGCSDGHYRYNCQDPANWETADCKPPVCSVSGSCPEDLVGTDIFNSANPTATK